MTQVDKKIHKKGVPANKPVSPSQQGPCVFLIALLRFCFLPNSPFTHAQTFLHSSRSYAFFILPAIFMAYLAWRFTLAQ